MLAPRAALKAGSRLSLASDVACDDGALVEVMRFSKSFICKASGERS